MKKLCLFLFALFSVIAAQAWTVGVYGNFNNWSTSTSGANAMKYNDQWGSGNVKFTNIPIGKNQAVRIVVLNYSNSTGKSTENGNNTYYYGTITLNSNGNSDNNGWPQLSSKVCLENASNDLYLKVEGSRDGDEYSIEVTPNNGYVQIVRTKQGPEVSEGTDLTGYEFYYKNSADNWADHYGALTGNVAKFTVDTSKGTEKDANNGFNFWFAKASDHNTKKYLTLSSSGDLEQTSTNTISKIDNSGTEYFAIKNANSGKFDIEVDVENMTLKVSPNSSGGTTTTTKALKWQIKYEGDANYTDLTASNGTYSFSPMKKFSLYVCETTTVKETGKADVVTENKKYFYTTSKLDASVTSISGHSTEGFTPLNSDSYKNFNVTFTPGEGVPSGALTVNVTCDPVSGGNTGVDTHDYVIYIEGQQDDSKKYIGDGLTGGWNNGKCENNKFKPMAGYSEHYLLTTTKLYNEAKFNILIGTSNDNCSYNTVSNNGNNYGLNGIKNNETLTLAAANEKNIQVSGDISNIYMVVFKDGNDWKIQFLDKSTYDSKYPAIGGGPEGTGHTIYICGQEGKAKKINADGTTTTINAMKGSADNQGKGDSDLSINSDGANKLTKVDENTYKIDVEFTNDSYFGIWIDGKHYSAKISSSTSGSCPEVKNGVKFDSQLYNREGWNEHITGGTQKRTVTVYKAADNNWYLKVRDYVASTDPNQFNGTVDVYFVDRAGWGAVNCYNYTDLNVYKDGNNWVTPSSDSNGGWPGKVMTKITEPNDPVVMGLDLTLYDDKGNVKSEKASVYKVTLTDLKKDDDGNLSRPKLVFNNNNGGKQTLNLFLVENGIYQNSYYQQGTGTEVKNGTEYLPNQWYDVNATGDEQTVYSYPNKLASTKYNVVYIDVPEFTDKAVQEKDIDFEIRYDRQGVKSYPATGITGLHKAYLTTINGKKYLRVALADYIVPNNTKVELYIWEHDNGEENKTYTADSNHVGATTNNPELVESGHHTLCVGSHCSLWYSNVDYFDGAVYRRGTVTDIVTLTAPDIVYMVDLNASNGAFSSMKGGSKVDNPTNLLSGTYYKMNKDNGADGKTNYIAKGVTENANFAYVGYWGNETEGNQYRVLSNSAKTAMKLGNLYPCISQSGKGFDYTIDTNLKTRTFNVTMNWENQNVTVDLVEIGAELEFLPQLDMVTSDGKHIMFGVADNCYYNTNNAEGHASHECGTHPETIVQIKHNNSFAGKQHEQHYDPKYVSVSVAPTPDYEYVFSGNSNANRLPDIIPNSVTGCGLFNAVEDDEEVSGVDLRCYTAAVYNLSVSNSRIIEEDNKLGASSTDVEVLVIPTVESVGLTLNYSPKSIVNTDRTKVGPQAKYEIQEVGEKYTETLSNGKTMTFDKDRVGFFPTMASGDLKIYWMYAAKYDEKAAQSSRRREASASGTSSDEVSSTGYALDPNLVRYTADPQMLGKEDENGVTYGPVITLDGINKNKGLYVQIQHNGITSPVFAATSTGSTPTEVEEIEVAEEFEAVYYDLNGVRVDAKNLVKGIYVKVVGNTAEKVMVK